MITSPDGHIYSLPKKLPMRPTVGNNYSSIKMNDNLGLKVPQTYDELVKVLQRFKDKDANGMEIQRMKFHLDQVTLTQHSLTSFHLTTV